MPRPHGTGGITQRKDGRFQGKYYVEGKTCYVYGKTRAECNRKLLAAIKESKQPKPAPVEQMTLAIYLPIWLVVF